MLIDLIVLAALVTFALIGWRQGLYQYLLTLAIELVSLGAGWCNYQLNQGILLSILVVICAFSVLSLLRQFVLRIKQRKTPQLIPISWIKRLTGAMLGLLWGTLLAWLFILSLDLLPVELILGREFKQKLHRCRSWKILQQVVPVKNLPISENLSYLGKVCLDKNAQARLAKQAQFQELLQCPGFQEIIKDQKLIQELQDKNIPRLLTNPKILNLLNDGQFAEKLFRLDFKKAYLQY